MQAPYGYDVGPRKYEEANSVVKYPNSICRLNGYEKNATTYVPICIIGAGESGLAMGCRLKQALGFDQFRIYDRQAGAGGTWWINRYPGVACDVPAVFYSFSFFPNHKWSSFHPEGPELVKYMHDACNKFEITDKIQLNTSVEGCKWLEEEKIWEVYLRHMVPGTGDLSVKDRDTKIEAEGVESVFLKRETIRAKVVISAVGALVEPNAFPDKIPGQDTFQGEIFHSARWRYDIDIKDKNVVVVGTGCSAAQFIPRLTKDYGARSVTQIMRSPPWVIPRHVPPFGAAAWEKHSAKVLSNVPFLAKALRTLIFFGAEYDMRLFGMEEHNIKYREKVEASLRRWMKNKVPEKYHEMLNPDYGVGCKRRIFDATWFPGLNDDKLDLTTQPLRSLSAKGVMLGNEQTYPKKTANVNTGEHEIPADVIVLANGFETTKWLHPLQVTGRHDVDLTNLMEQRGGPQAYQGTAMDGFPNFFAIFGPNTATGHSSVILASENMVNYSLKFIKKILDGDVTTVEVKQEAEQAYTADIQKALKETVWHSGGCNSWYVHDGWNSQVYPYTQIWFGLRCMFPNWNDWNIEYTRKGLIKRRVSQGLRYIAFILAFLWTYRARKSPGGLRSIPSNVVQVLQIAMMTGRNALSAVIAQ